jgi:hypothetical protein
MFQYEVKWVDVVVLFGTVSTGQFERFGTVSS